MAYPAATIILRDNGDGTSSSYDKSSLLAPYGVSAGSPTSSTAVVAWSYIDSGQTGFEIRASVDNETWFTVATAFADDRAHTVVGLASETQYYLSIRAIDEGEGRKSQWSSSATVTTSEAADWQYQPGEYAPSRMPLQMISPNGQEGEGSRYRYCHSEFDYIVGVTVQGGAPPFMFEFDGPAPEGATITRKAPEWNPHLYLWAEIVIPAGSSGSYTVKATDQEGATVTATVETELDDSRFVVVDPESGSDSTGDGSVGNPFQTLAPIWEESTTDSSYSGKVCVLRSGHHVIAAFNSDASGMRISSNKPRAIIPYPGEAVELNLGTNIVTAPGSNTDDIYLGQFAYNAASLDQTNTRVLSFLGSQTRVVIDRPAFVSVPTGASGSDNESCIYAPQSSPGHSYFGIIEPRADGLGVSHNGVSLFDFFNMQDWVVAGGAGVNLASNYVAWAKNNTDRGSIWGLDFYDVEGSGNASKQFYGQQATAGDKQAVQFGYCRAYRASDGLNSDGVVAWGSTSNAWGTVWFDRMTAVGRAAYKGGTAREMGIALVSDSIIINDQSPHIDATGDTGTNITAPRSQLSNLLDSDGDLTGDGLEYYGTKGAQVKPPGASV